MAIVNLGSIKFNWKGAYAGGTAYAVDDVVSYNGTSYVCILASTGNLPTNATYWNVMAQGGTDVGTTLTTQGDILYRDGSGLQRLPIGTAGQALKVNSSANGFEFGTAGGLLQSVTATTESTTQTTSTSFVAASGLNASITPSSTSSKILVLATVALNNNTGNQWAWATIYRGSTNLGNSNGMVGMYSQGGDIHGNGSIVYLDSPSTTSATTYTYYFRVSGGTGHVNQQPMRNSITLLEIGV